ncbi:MAG TPA: hypothetical protein VJG32_21085 [Anaerolineae bacterium]|nr:hypothetical protein [Anaerolineae bacterium]
MQPDSSVLIAVMNSPRDFQLAREASWYRIPQQSAPKFFPPEFVAFYFTKPFGADAYAVRWYAEVRGHELATRRDLLPAEPGHPHAERVYYKLQLGPLLELPHQIPSRRWRRLTFILTTGERLFSAWEINDLVVGSHENDLMWRALKEAGLDAERDDELPNRQRVDFLLPCNYGDLGIVVSDEPQRDSPEYVLHFTPGQINDALDDCLYQIKQAIEQRGGVQPTSQRTN